MKKLQGKSKVELIEIHGDEALIKRISGVSHNSPGAGVEKLLDWGHLSPLEFAGVTFKIKAPIFVARQIMRHRTGKYMENSLRYCESSLEFYIPNELEGNAVYMATLENCRIVYEHLLAEHGKGRGNELARNILPVCTFTEFYLQMDMRNLAHFLGLRLDEGTQEETREIANMMLDLISDSFPIIAAHVREEVSNA